MLLRSGLGEETYLPECELAVGWGVEAGAGIAGCVRCSLARGHMWGKGLAGRARGEMWRRGLCWQGLASSGAAHQPAVG